MMDESLTDKFILLKAARFKMPMPTETADEQERFWDRLMSELPAFVHFLRWEFTIPEAIRSNRFGVLEYAHPDLLQALDELAPQTKFLQLVDRHLFGGTVPQPWEGTASELEQELRAAAQGVAKQAGELLNYHTACGAFLGRLKAKIDRITDRRSGNDRIWRIEPPEDSR